MGELGGHQLYPEDPAVGEEVSYTLDLHTAQTDHLADRRPALLSILRSLLLTYSLLLKALLLPPPSPHSADPPEWQKHIEWMTIMAQNIMSAANDLRPVQARFNLETMMKRQLQLRREETSSIHR